MTQEKPPTGPIGPSDATEPADGASPAQGAMSTQTEPPDDSAGPGSESGKGAGSRMGRMLHGDNPVLLTFLALVLAGLVGAVLIAIGDPATRAASKYFFAAPLDTVSAALKAVGNAYLALFEGSVVDPSSFASGSATAILGPISETLVNATPLILGGLSVALAFRAGLFNIGGQGQIIIGAVFAGYVGFAWDLPVVVHVLVALAAGTLGGALWGGIAGWLKARTGAHEVITTIMLNYIAFNLLAFLLGTPGFQAPPFGQAISNPVEGNARLPHLLGGDLRVHAGLLIALLAALGCWWLLDRSTLGFRLRAVGANQNAARTAGMHVERSYVAVMLIAGGLCGLAGCAQILGTNPAITQDIDAGIGFDAITVALLGRGKPGGTVLAGLLFGALRAGSVTMLSVTGTPVDLVQVVQALIVMFIAAPALVQAVFRVRARGGVGQVLAKGWNG
jgi:simple sugar transport system permease protein